MRILLTTEFVDAPSTEIYRRLLQEMNESTGSSFHFGGRDYENYDVIIFMGYDPDFVQARKVNPKATIGIIDVRPASGIPLAGADFLLANGVEMKDFWAGSIPHILVYEPSWLVSDGRADQDTDDSTLRIGYHGNLVHLNEMYPRITKAIEAVAKDRSVEFTAVYNVKNLGRWTIGLPDPNIVKTQHIQWGESVFNDYLRNVDIGITPNMTPFRNPLSAKRSHRVSRRAYLDDDTDTIIRYKSNSNAGRMMVFAQYAIPVVSDPFPSAAKFIGDEVGGLMSTTAGGWYSALNQLAESKEYRLRMGDALREKWVREASPTVLNKRLLTLLEKIRQGDVPSSVSLAEYRDFKWTRWTIIKMRVSTFTDRVKRKIRGRVNKA